MKIKHLFSFILLPLVLASGLRADVASARNALLQGDLAAAATALSLLAPNAEVEILRSLLDIAEWIEGDLPTFATLIGADSTAAAAFTDLSANLNEKKSHGTQPIYGSSLPLATSESNDVTTYQFVDQESILVLYNSSNIVKNVAIDAIFAGSLDTVIPVSQGSTRIGIYANDWSGYVDMYAQYISNNYNDWYDGSLQKSFTITIEPGEYVRLQCTDQGGFPDPGFSLGSTSLSFSTADVEVQNGEYWRYDWVPSPADALFDFELIVDSSGNPWGEDGLLAVDEADVALDYFVSHEDLLYYGYPSRSLSIQYNGTVARQVDLEFNSKAPYNFTGTAFVNGLEVGDLKPDGFYMDGDDTWVSGDYNQSSSVYSYTFSLWMEPGDQLSIEIESGLWNTSVDATAPIFGFNLDSASDFQVSNGLAYTNVYPKFAPNTRSETFAHFLSRDEASTAQLLNTLIARIGTIQSGDRVVFEPVVTGLSESVVIEYADAQVLLAFLKFTRGVQLVVDMYGAGNIDLGYANYLNYMAAPAAIWDDYPQLMELVSSRRGQGIQAKQFLVEAIQHYRNVEATLWTRQSGLTESYLFEVGASTEQDRLNFANNLSVFETSLSRVVTLAEAFNDPLAPQDQGFSLKPLLSNSPVDLRAVMPQFDERGVLAGSSSSLLAAGFTQGIDIKKFDQSLADSNLLYFPVIESYGNTDLLEDSSGYYAGSADTPLIYQGNRVSPTYPSASYTVVGVDEVNGAYRLVLTNGSQYYAANFSLSGSSITAWAVVPVSNILLEEVNLQQDFDGDGYIGWPSPASIAGMQFEYTSPVSSVPHQEFYGSDDLAAYGFSDSIIGRISYTYSDGVISFPEWDEEIRLTFTSANTGTYSFFEGIGPGEYLDDSGTFSIVTTPSLEDKTDWQHTETFDGGFSTDYWNISHDLEDRVEVASGALNFIFAGAVEEGEEDEYDDYVDYEIDLDYSRALPMDENWQIVMDDVYASNSLEGFEFELELEFEGQDSSFQCGFEFQNSWVQGGFGNSIDAFYVSTIQQGIDINGDGVIQTVPYAWDLDGDGVIESGNEYDYDGDGNLDTVDEDLDGDFRLDRGEDSDGDGHLDNGWEDRNYDGVLSTNEVDVDGDGHLDNGYEDLDGDGFFDSINEDVDGDGYLDYNEDLDGDYNLDVAEDLNYDGVLNNGGTGQPAIPGGPYTLLAGEGALLNEVLDFVDYNGDGVIAGVFNEDVDGDGKLDRTNEDVDGDGNLDTVDEDLDGDGRLDRGEDSDGDGHLDNGYEDLNNDGVLSTNEVDVDGDGHLDYGYEDFDGDGVLDIGEDLDGDGYLDNGYEDFDGDGKFDLIDETNIVEVGAGPVVGGVATDLDINGDGIIQLGVYAFDIDGDGRLDRGEVDYDGDGHLDNGFEDSNHDGVLSTNEDLDGDGHLDNGYEDLDGDGFFDSINEDVDGDGYLDYNEDLDGDYNLDVAEDLNYDGVLNNGGTGQPAIPGGPYTLLAGEGALLNELLDFVDYNGDGVIAGVFNEDVDGDGKLDRTNEDVDGDGNLDTVDEDLDGDGRLDRGEVDVDGDGHLDNGYEDLNNDGVLSTNEVDVDGDGHLDNGYEDSNGNGVLDIGEDLDGDGYLDNGYEDFDGDGFFDSINEDVDGDGYLDYNEDLDGDGRFDIVDERNIVESVLSYRSGGASVSTIEDSRIQSNVSLRITHNANSRELVFEYQPDGAYAWSELARLNLASGDFSGLNTQATQGNAELIGTSQRMELYLEVEAEETTQAGDMKIGGIEIGAYTPPPPPASPESLLGYKLVGQFTEASPGIIDTYRHDFFFTGSETVQSHYFVESNDPSDVDDWSEETYTYQKTGATTGTFAITNSSGETTDVVLTFDSATSGTAIANGRNGNSPNSASGPFTFVPYDPSELPIESYGNTVLLEDPSGYYAGSADTPLIYQGNRVSRTYPSASFTAVGVDEVNGAYRLVLFNGSKYYVANFSLSGSNISTWADVSSNILAEEVNLQQDLDGDGYIGWPPPASLSGKAYQFNIGGDGALSVPLQLEYDSATYSEGFAGSLLDVNVPYTYANGVVTLSSGSEIRLTFTSLTEGTFEYWHKELGLDSVGTFIQVTPSLVQKTDWQYTENFDSPLTNDYWQVWRRSMDSLVSNAGELNFLFADGGEDDYPEIAVPYGRTLPMNVDWQIVLDDAYAASTLDNFEIEFYLDLENTETSFEFSFAFADYGSDGSAKAREVNVWLEQQDVSGVLTTASAYVSANEDQRIQSNLSLRILHTANSRELRFQYQPGDASAWTELARLNLETGVFTSSYLINGEGFSGQLISSSERLPLEIIAEAGEVTQTGDLKIGGIEIGNYTPPPTPVDSDGDGLDDSVETNTGEYLSTSDTGTNPLLADSSGDGFTDGEIVSAGYDPNISYREFLNFFGLVDLSSIIDAQLGQLGLERGADGNFDMNYDLEISTDLQNWTPHLSETIEISVPDQSKTFMRLNVK